MLLKLTADMVRGDIQEFSDYAYTLENDGGQILCG